VHRNDNRQGSGYFKPETISKEDFEALYAEWDKKLADTGFKDIEHRDRKGFFRANMYNDEDGPRTLYNKKIQNEFYFELCTEFANTFNFYYHFKKDALVYKWLWEFYCNGVPFRSMAKAFRGGTDKHIERCRPLPRKLMRRCSYFWTFTHTTLILKHFWKWAKKKHEWLPDEKPPER